MRLLKNKPPSSVTYKQYFLTPTIYQQLKYKLPQHTLPTEIWATLYTHWGESIAACLEGDTLRAIQIKVNQQAQTALEKFAEAYIAYQLGCYFLKQYQWKEAISYLQAVKSHLQSNSTWGEEIDSLCQKQRQQISSYSDDLAFSTAWYNLLQTKESKCYYVDCQVKEINDQLADEKITSNTAIQQLNALKNIDPNNALIKDLLERINRVEESKRVYSLLEQGQYQQAVNLASRSSNSKMRENLAMMFLEILEKNSHSLPDHQKIEIYGWIRQLCPDLF